MTLFCKFGSVPDRKMKKYNLLHFLLLCCVLGCSKDKDLAVEIEDNQTLSTPQIEDPIKIFPCENGFAGRYPCSGFDLYSHIDLEMFDSLDHNHKRGWFNTSTRKERFMDLGSHDSSGVNSGANDIWGWIDPQTDKEYAIVGLIDGTAFVDISNPLNPLYLGKLPSATEPSIWRDIKVNQNFAYIVSEASNHGLQVFDLTRLRGITEKRQIFSADFRESSFGNAHNIAINQESGFGYVLGSQKYGGGPIFFDLSNKSRPVEIGGYSLEGYAHDAQIITYQGTDIDYLGKEIYIGSHTDGESFNKLIILDVSDKSNPIKISETSYQNAIYTHQNWISEDHRHIFLGDEGDELVYGVPTRTLIFNVENLENPILHHEYEGVTNAIDHNGFIKGDNYYMANYTAGLRVIDIENIEVNQMREIGFFDTYPTNNEVQFHGAWSVYPFFESGIIAINDIDNGLFLVKQSENDQ